MENYIIIVYLQRLIKLCVFRLLNYVNHSQSDADTVIDMDVSVKNQRHFDFPESNKEFNIIEPLEVNHLSPEIGPRYYIFSLE